MRMTSYSTSTKATAEATPEGLGPERKRKIPDVSSASPGLCQGICRAFKASESMGSYHRAKTSGANEIACSGKSELFLS